MIQRSQINWKNIKSYIQGNLRYKLFYSKRFSKLIRLHIFEQINYRIFVMDKECYRTGSCKLCGCNTVALQMCDKACDKPCYPEMMKKEKWEAFKLNNRIIFIYNKRSRNREFELKIYTTKIKN